MTIKIINAIPSGLLSQRKPEVFKNGISVKLPGDYRTVGLVKYIVLKAMINESPSMSWIDRILVQIGADLKKRHGNHAFYGQNTSKYGTVWAQ